MAKGKKKDKKGKKGKKGKGSKKSKNKRKVESDNDEPDPNVICSQGEFILPNEDVYIGEYCAHRRGLIWREGRGIYKTKNGQEYEGQWHNDKLVESAPVEIRYPEGHTYIGLLAKNKYNGAGTYYCSDVIISCNFENNKPQGEVALIDPKGEVYVGKAHETGATLLPANVLFDNINPSRGIIYDPTNVADASDVESGITCLFSETATKDDEQLKTKDDATWKNIVFAKSKKTDARMFFEESDWYKDWLQFKTTKQRIKSAVPSNEEHSLTASYDDAQWLEEYEQYKRLREGKTSTAKEAMNKKDLLSVFQSVAYKNSSPAVRVVYPSSNWDTFNSATDSVEGKESIDLHTDEKERNRIRTGSVPFLQFLKSVDMNSAKNVTRKSSKCLNKKNYGCSTNSLMAFVDNFFNNKPVSKLSHRNI